MKNSRRGPPSMFMSRSPHKMSRSRVSTPTDPRVCPGVHDLAVIPIRAEALASLEIDVWLERVERSRLDKCPDDTEGEEEPVRLRLETVAPVAAPHPLGVVPVDRELRSVDRSGCAAFPAWS